MPEDRATFLRLDCFRCGTGQACLKLETSARVKQSIVTLDLEGVLVPEIWIAVAEKTGIKELRLTTRDIPDYDVPLPLWVPI